MSLDALIAALAAALTEQTARARALRSRSSSPPRRDGDAGNWIEHLAHDGVGLACAVLHAEEIRAAIARHLGLDECDCAHHRDEAHERAAKAN